MESADRLTPQERSRHMAGVKSTGNRSTEGAVESVLLERGIVGWIKHPADVDGRPDFCFPERRLAVFVDGCFWHACPRCARNTPTTRQEFWANKIDATRRRDNRIRRRLRADGYRVMRIWEHAVRSGTWLARLESMLRS